MVTTDLAALHVRQLSPHVADDAVQGETEKLWIITIISNTTSSKGNFSELQNWMNEGGSSIKFKLSQLDLRDGTTVGVKTRKQTKRKNMRGSASKQDLN